MTNKIKLLLWSFLTILFVWLSSTYALTFNWNSEDIKVISWYNGYNMWGNGNYLYCINENYKYSANLKVNISCRDWYAKRWLKSDSIWLVSINDRPKISEGYWFYLWKYADSNDVFSLRAFDDDWQKKYMKITMKNIGSKLFQIKSKRWDNVYDYGIVDWIWFSVWVRDWDQVRVAQVIENSYGLDWFLLVASNYTSYLFDTYENKAYKYNNNFFPSELWNKWGLEIFSRLRNIVPDEVYDITWGLPTKNRIYYNSREYKTFDMINKTEWTKKTLEEIRNNIRKSLIIFNKEHVERFLGAAPEELWISSNPDLPKNNNENTGNTVAKNATREEKKSCVAYYTYMRSMSSHSDWCLWEVNKDMSDTRLDYWWAISTDWDLSKFWVRDKTKYRRCWHWNNYKEGVKKTLWDKWPAFWKDRQTNYIATEAKDIDVNALCSHIVVWSQINSWGLTFDNFSKAIEWTLLSRGDTVWTLNWVSVPKNVFERDYALMMRYEIACKDKVKLPTEYDTFSDYLLFKSFWGDNNKNVCKKAEELKEKFKEKYKDLIFTKNYEKAFKSDFGEDSVSSSWTVVVEKALSWSIDKAFKFKSPFAFWEKTAWALVDYFTKDYTDWYNKGFSLLGWKGCGAWIWVKEWDYIMRLFLFMILIWLVWKS